MKTAPLISYRREGRKLRASGTLIERWQGMAKVKPLRDDWGIVWVSPEEIEAGSQKGPPIARKAPVEGEERKKRERVPKPPPKPRWKELVGEIRILEIDHVPEGWPCVKMKLLSEIADELEAMATMFSKP
jgi:hypothetical protein